MIRYIDGYTASLKSSVLNALQSQGCNVSDISTGIFLDLAETARSTSKLLSNSMVPYLRSALYVCSQESLDNHYVARSLFDAAAIANTYQTINNTRVYDYTELLDLVVERMTIKSRCYVLYNDVIHLMDDASNKYRILSEYEKYRDIYMEKIINLYSRYEQDHQILTLSAYGDDLKSITYNIVNRVKSNL